MNRKVGIAGLGSIGSEVAHALSKGIVGLEFHRVSEQRALPEFEHLNTNFERMAAECDLIVEALPASIVPELARAAVSKNRDIIIISSAALVIYPEILDQYRRSEARIFVPSGAIGGLDAVGALKHKGIVSATIASTKPPRGFMGAPFIVDNSVDLDGIKEATLLFKGNALTAAKAFPANVNVAATLSLAGIGPEKTMVEVWADPDANGNTHVVTVESATSKTTHAFNSIPDPKNPKTSASTAGSIINTLTKLSVIGPLGPRNPESEPLIIL